MNLTLVILLVIIAAAVATAWFGPKSKPASFVFATTFLALGAFSVFGFLAGFEPMDDNQSLIWKSFYAVLILTSGIGLVRSSRRILRSS